MRNRRKLPRYLFSVSGKLSEATGGAALEVTIVNISRHGGCSEGAGALKVGERRVLNIDWRGAQIRLEVEVSWSEAQGRTGFRFLSVEKEDRERLQELCSTLRLLSAAASPSRAA